MTIIRPIDVTIYAYGAKGNVSAVKKGCLSFLKDERDDLSKDEREGLVTDMEAPEVRAYLDTHMWDQGIDMLKVLGSHQGVKVELPQVHARMADEFIREMRLAKTCVMCAMWHNPNEGKDHQRIAIAGDKLAESREV